MFILYFYGIHHEYHRAKFEAAQWAGYDNFRPGEGYWLVPGTDPDDCSLPPEEVDGDENDETLEYMCDLLEAHEIEPDEFRRQLRSVGYADQTITAAIASVAA